jgi:hypothetical protein
LEHTEASMLDGILPADTTLSSIQENRPIFHKVNASAT